MGRYGKAAVKAVELLKKSGEVHDPKDAWEKATADIFGDNTSRQKGCPRCTFLALCEEGKIEGIPPGNYTTSEENKKYAIKAVEILQKEPTLSSNQEKLWRRVLEELKKENNNVDCDKAHNQQMDVVTSLWKKKLIITQEGV